MNNERTRTSIFGAASGSFSGVSLFIIKKLHAVIHGYKLTETITACPQLVVAIPTPKTLRLPCLATNQSKLPNIVSGCSGFILTGVTTSGLASFPHAPTGQCT
jgi:hypothetical protein